MEKTLPELVEVLKSRNLDYAVFNWTAQDRFSEWFDHKVYFRLGGKFVSSKEIAADYQDAVADLLREHYPKFDHFLGTYGEVYVYSSGKISIVLTQRVYGEEYHRKDVDLCSSSTIL